MVPNRQNVSIDDELEQSFEMLTKATKTMASSCLSRTLVTQIDPGIGQSLSDCKQGFSRIKGALSSQAPEGLIAKSLILPEKQR